MKTVLIDQIKIETRQRSKMDKEKLQNLKTSIADKGLMHPPVFRFDKFNIAILVAGERRVTAIKQLHEEGILFSCDGATVPPGLLPYTELSDLTEIKFLEAELEENILREDLSWQDKVEATNDLHQLRKAQNPEQTQLDTALEIAKASGKPDIKKGGATQMVSRATLVADWLDDPDVQRAKSDREAFKIVSRKIEAQFQSKLGVSKTSLHKLIEGDFTKVVDKVRSSRFTCVLADPPYGIGANTFGDAAVLSHQYKDNPATALAFSQAIIHLSYRITDMQAYLFLFCDIDLFTTLRSVAKGAGWKPFRTPIIWEKGSRGHVPEQSGLRRSYELILCASKGNKKMSRIESDVMSIPRVSEPLHAAQKPVALYRRLLQLVCVHGDPVLDPCCGAGTIFSAAHELGLKATGVELDPKQIVNSKATIGKLYE